MRLDHAALLWRAGAEIALTGCMQKAGMGVDRAAASRCRLHLSHAQWMVALPTLGDVFYVAAFTGGASWHEMTPGMLAEAAELVPLLHWSSLEAVAEITPDGPREWIECRTAEARISARLYLLPDTDYLAWDGLHVEATPIAIDESAPTAGAWHPLSARLLRFRTRRLAGLQVLSDHIAGNVSPLGMRLAARLVRDEAA